MAYALLGVHRRSETIISERSPQAHPMCVQLGAGLTRSAHDWLRNLAISNAV
jgi:hypothetical protein